MQKLRLRVYNDADLNSAAFFEVKQKHNKVVNKRRMLIPLHEAYRYIKDDKHIPLDDYDTSNLQVLKEIDSFRRLRSEEHTSELQSRGHLVCRLLLEKKKTYNKLNN